MSTFIFFREYQTFLLGPLNWMQEFLSMMAGILRKVIKAAPDEERFLPPLHALCSHKFCPSYCLKRQVELS